MKKLLLVLFFISEFAFGQVMSLGVIESQKIYVINDICPAGFRLPTQPEWSALVTAAGITNSATAYSSSLKLTVTGSRDNASAGINNQGSYGYCWSSSVTGNFAYGLYFNVSSASSSNNFSRALGFSVRCIANSGTNFSVGQTVYDTYGLPYITVLGADGNIWLDRNLGATQVATAFNDYRAYGSLFQWGRGADGHQLITYTSATAGTPVNGNTSTLSTTDIPGDALFIKAPLTPFDWRSPQNVNLWH